MEHGARDRTVVELDAFRGLAQQQPAAAHVTAADEVGGKLQALAENCEQHVDVLRRGDAAEEDDVAAVAELARQRPRALLERPPVGGVVGMDVGAGELPKGRRASPVSRAAAARHSA